MGIGGNYSGRSTALTKSLKPTFDALRTRSSTIPTAPSASSRTLVPEELPSRASNPQRAPLTREVHDETHSSTSARDCDDAPRSARDWAGCQLEADSCPAASRIQAAAAEAHRAFQRHGDFPAGRSRIAPD